MCRHTWTHIYIHLGIHIHIHADLHVHAHVYLHELAVGPSIRASHDAAAELFGIDGSLTPNVRLDEVGGKCGRGRMPRPLRVLISAVIVWGC